MISPNTAAVQEEQQPRFLLKELIYLKFFQKAWRGYEEKPVKDAQKILDGISALFGEEVASK